MPPLSRIPWKAKLCADPSLPPVRPRGRDLRRGLRREEEERNGRRDSSLTLGIRLASVSLPSPSSWTVFVQTCVVLSPLPTPPWSIRTKTLKRGHPAEAAPPVTSNLGSQVQVHLGTSRDRVGPGFTELLGTGSGPRQAPGAPAPLAASCHFLLRFLDLPGGQLPGPVNQALQNATHLDRTGGEPEPEGWPLWGWGERSTGTQSAACPCPLPSFKEDVYKGRALSPS